MISGAVSGFFGAGGGVISVLMFQKVMKLDAQKAHASAVAAILPITVISSVIYITKGAVDVPLTVKTSIGALAGGIIAGVLLCKIKSELLSKIFGGIMIATGAWSLIC